MVKAGSRYESARHNGLSHFLEHMLFRGTRSLPSAYQLNLAIEELGGTLRAATYVDYTVFQINVPPESIPAAIALFGEMLREPAFEGIDVEKGIVREEILEGVDEDGRPVDADDVARDLLFSPHPLGYKIIGRPGNIDRFSLADLRAHMKRHYVGANMVVSIAGAVDPAMAAPLMREHLQEVPPGEETRPTLPAVQSGGPRWRYVDSQGSQTDVRISFPTVGEHDERYVALQLLARVLDDGMSTRVHRRICDEKGLAYEAFAGLDPYEDCGVLDLGASVEHAKTAEVVRELLDIVRELRDDPPSDREIDKAKRRFVWELRALRDEAAGMAAHHGTAEIFNLPDDLDRNATRVLATRAEDLLDVARLTFRPDQMTVAAVGVLNRPQDIPKIASSGW